MTLARTWPLPLEVVAHHGRFIESLTVLRRLSTGDSALRRTAFDGLTIQEREDLLTEMRVELDHEVSLALIASCEAVLRADFKARRRQRPRSTRVLNRNFRDLFARSTGRVRLDDILDAWRVWTGTNPNVFSVFGDYLRMRHWLAHGRHWTLRVARAVDPVAIMVAADDLFNLLPGDFPLIE